MFDRAVLINQNSSDKSLQILRDFAPSTWQVVDSGYEFFSAVQIDLEVVYHEQSSRVEDWRIALTTTEFLVQKDLRSFLDDVDVPMEGQVFKFPAVVIYGNDSVGGLNLDSSLPFQRSVYGIKWGSTDASPYPNTSMYGRFIHAGHLYYKYGPGRHWLVNKKHIEFPGPGFIMKFVWSPWPECISRKKQIGARVPTSDIKQNFGTHHLANLIAIEAEREKALKTVDKFFNLRSIVDPSDPAFKCVVAFHESLSPKPLFD
jgi:hypothetical protein